jgi:nucleotidyltransferase substrate binding protein (TIGR01987 family)
LALDTGPFERAIARLAEGIARYQRDPADAQIRDGLIQRFEFTYDLAVKTLQRFLEMSLPAFGTTPYLDFQDLIRSANAQGLLPGDWPLWRGYREMRNRASHTYDEDQALQVVAGIPAFLSEVSSLRERIRHRLAGSAGCSR